MTWFTIGWIVIFTAGLGLEAVAFFNKRRGDTLSEHVWVLAEARLFRVFILLGGVWLIAHFLWGEMF